MAGIYGPIHTRSTGGQYIDMKEDISAVLRYGHLYDVPFWAALNRGNAINTTHQWETDAPRTLSGAMRIKWAGSAGATSVSVTSATHANFQVGDLVRVADELVRVTARSSTTLTVSRGYGGTTRTTHATTTVVTIVSNSFTEGASAPSAYALALSLVTNQCQIFYKSIDITGTRRAVSSHVGDLWAQMVLKNSKEHVREIERALLHGKIQTATANTTSRAMRGIVDAISTVRYTTTTSLTTARLNTFFKACDTAGGSPNICFIDSTMLQAIHELNLGYVQVDSFDMGAGTLGGVRAQRWFSPWGEKYLFLCRQLGAPIGHTGNMLAITAEEVKVCPLNGRDMVYEEMAKTGDSDKATLLSEVTLEWGNEKFHGYLGNKS
jgi:hypothetical protein